MHKFVTSDRDGKILNSFTAEEKSGLFIGHTRFSVHNYGSGQFNATRDATKGVGFTEAEYTSWLYNERRLEPRIEMFTRYSLPQLALGAETCDLVHYVSYSPSLPEKYKSQLREAAGEYKFLKLNETSGTVSSFPPRSLLDQVVAKFKPASRVYGVYRLDDDDVLSINYFKQMAPYLIWEHRGWWVSLGSGVSAISDGSSYVFARKHYRPKFALGLLYVGGMTEDGKAEAIRGRKHTIVDKFAPTIVDSRQTAFFHLRHKGQDSSLDAKEKPFYAEAFANLRGGDRAELDVVRNNFPYLAYKVTTTPGPSDYALPLSGPTKLGTSGKKLIWGIPGALSLQIEPSGTTVKPQELKVRLTVVSLEGKRVDSPGHRKFFSNGKVHWSAEGGFYWAWVPSYDTGEGLVLPIEPPDSLMVTDLRVSAERGREVPTRSIFGYKLGA